MIGGICDKVTGVLMGSISIAPAESCEREKPYACTKKITSKTRCREK